MKFTSSWFHLFSLIHTANSSPILSSGTPKAFKVVTQVFKVFFVAFAIFMSIVRETVCKFLFGHLCFTDGGVGVQELLDLPVMFFISVVLIVVFMVTININNVISMVLIVIKMLRIKMSDVIIGVGGGFLGDNVSHQCGVDVE